MSTHGSQSSTAGNQGLEQVHTYRTGAIVLAAVMLARGTPAIAQQQSSWSELLAPADAPMTLAEYQGLSCAGFGVLAGVLGLAYVSPIEEATRISTAMLAAPLVATGFAVGCSVGSTLAPGFLWIYRHFGN